MKKGQYFPNVIENKQLMEQIISAQTRLYDKLSNLDIKLLKISEYNQRYLGKKITGLKGILQLYGRLIYLCMNKSIVPTEKFVLVDYGGGSGVISLLATEMGIGTVIYNDIYDVSCRDIKNLSNALGLKLNHIVHGDVDELISYIKVNSISINAITSYDVLEHIYDVQYHFKKLGCLTNNTFRIVYGSGANIENPLYVHSVKKVQIETEYKEKEKKWGHKERDTLQAFLNIRKNIISAYAPNLNSELVEKIAKSTRGLIKRDIEKCVDEFLLNGNTTYHIDHPTNTCDPYTGNWCEHLMKLEWIERSVKNAGFSAEIMTGQYSTCGSLPTKSIKTFLNAIIQLLKRKGMFIAPYYVVYANFPRQC